MSIKDYFTKFEELWDELDGLDPIASCTCSGCEYQLTQKTIKSQQRARVIQFLMKLDAKYKQTRSSLIMMQDLPTLSEIYCILVQEQVHQGISTHDESEVQEVSMAHRVEKKKFMENRYKNSNNKRQNTYYDHCKMQGHTMEKYRKIYGYPPKYKKKLGEKRKKLLARLTMPQMTHAAGPLKKD